MSKLIPTLLLLLLITTSGLIHAKPLANKEKVDQVSALFMSQIQARDVETAYSMLSAYLGVNLEQFNERAKKVATNMAQIEQSAGKPLAFTLLKQQSVGEHFYKLTYLLKYQAAALVWELNYYQPEQGWNLVDVSFNTDINALFDQ